MNHTELALLGYVAWFLTLLLLIEFIRTYTVVSTQRLPNSFRPDGSDVSDFMHRVCRAHANCYESFPFVGGILIFAMASGTTSITDGLALYLLGARVAQSLVHLSSASPLFAQIRFLFFLAQITIVCYWLAAYLV